MPTVEKVSRTDAGLASELREHCLAALGRAELLPG